MTILMQAWLVSFAQAPQGTSENCGIVCDPQVSSGSLGFELVTANSWRDQLWDMHPLTDTSSAASEGCRSQKKKKRLCTCNARFLLRTSASRKQWGCVTDGVIGTPKRLQWKLVHCHVCLWCTFRKPRQKISTYGSVEETRPLFAICNYFTRYNETTECKYLAHPMKTKTSTRAAKVNDAKLHIEEKKTKRNIPRKMINDLGMKCEGMEKFVDSK